MTAKTPEIDEMDRIFAELEQLPPDLQESEAAFRKAKRTLGLRTPVVGLRTVWKYFQRVAAIIVIPLLCGAIYFFLTKSDGTQPVWSELMVPDMQIRELTLPDGSTLFINSGSRITYPDAFSGNNREIFLDGQVRAEIAKDPKHPFIIRSGEIAVKVYGTKFDFKTYNKSDLVELYLMDGSVSLEVESGEQLKSIPLVPGECIQYSRASKVIEKKSFLVDSLESFADNGGFSFRNTPLGDVAADLERRFGERVIFKNPAIEKVKIFAIYSNGESLRTILDDISTTLGGATVSQNGNVWIIGE